MIKVIYFICNYMTKDFAFLGFIMLIIVVKNQYVQELKDWHFKLDNSTV